MRYADQRYASSQRNSSSVAAQRRSHPSRMAASEMEDKDRINGNDSAEHSNVKVSNLFFPLPVGCGTCTGFTCRDPMRAYRKSSDYKGF